MIKKRSFASTYLALFSIMFGYGIIVPFIDYFSVKFDVSIFMSGYIISVYALGQLLFSPIAGELLLVFNKRLILLIGLILYGVMSVYTFFASSFGLLLFSRFLCGVFASVVFPSAESYVSVLVSNSNPRYVTKVSILLSTACGIGMACAPLVGTYLLVNSMISVTGYLVCVICLFSGILGYFVLSDNLKDSVFVRFELVMFIKNVFVQIFRLYRFGPARLVLNSFLFYGVITSSLEAFIFKFLKDKEIITHEFPYFLVVLVVLLCLGYLLIFSSKLEHKLSYYNTLLLYSGVSGVCFVLIYLVPGVRSFLFLIIVSFFSLALYSSVCVAFVTNEFEFPERILAIKNSLICIGMVVGPIIGGLLYQFDPEFVFLFLGWLLILNMVYGLFRK